MSQSIRARLEKLEAIIGARPLRLLAAKRIDGRLEVRGMRQEAAEDDCAFAERAAAAIGRCLVLLPDDCEL
jgi:hypothetical protein